MQSTNIPAKFPIPFANSAGSGFVRTVPQASQIGITPGAASLTDGFPPVCFQPVGAGGVPPSGQDFNGLLNQLSSWSRWSAAGGPVYYDATFSASISGYPKGAMLDNLTTPGAFWVSTAENNTSNPDAGGANWVPLSNSSGVRYGPDGGAAGALIVNPTPALSSLVAGTVLLVHNIVAANTGATTLNVNSLGAVAVTFEDGTVFAGGELAAGMDALFEYDGAKWRMLSKPPLSYWDSRYPKLSLPPSGSTFYVNSTTGNDANNGLTSGTAFQTIQGAINTISNKYLSVTGVTINVADGTYSGFVVSQSFIGLWSIVGDVTTPANVVINSLSAGVNGGIGIGVTAANVNIYGITINSYYATFEANNLANVRLNNVNWTAPTQSGWSVFNSFNLSSIYMYGTFNGSGGAQTLFTASSNASIQVGDQLGVTRPATITLTGTPAFSVATAYALQGGSINIVSPVVTFTGAATGVRYNATINGTINTVAGGSTFIPGSSAGVTSLGGQYA